MCGLSIFPTYVLFHRFKEIRWVGLFRSLRFLRLCKRNEYDRRQFVVLRLALCSVPFPVLFTFLHMLVDCYCTDGEAWPTLMGLVVITWLAVIRYKYRPSTCLILGLVWIECDISALPQHIRLQSVKHSLYLLFIYSHIKMSCIYRVPTVQ
jgi:hypothetical protein